MGEDSTMFPLGKLPPIGDWSLIPPLGNGLPMPIALGGRIDSMLGARLRLLIEVLGRIGGGGGIMDGLVLPGRSLPGKPCEDVEWDCWCDWE